MSVIARFEVILAGQAEMAGELAAAVEALDEFDVSYELTATDTVVEADDTDEVFDVEQAAHSAVDADRVITSLEVDDHRRREEHVEDWAESVAEVLGRESKRERGE